MKRWLNEPLLHFVVAGGLIFALYASIDRGSVDEPRVVRITAQEIHWLKETWSRQWQRTPTEAELRGIVGDYLRESLLAREALELGLDENDTIVRRRLAQKMEFLVLDTARLEVPDDSELLRLYDSEQARHQVPARVSFTQVYFKTEAAARLGLQELATASADDLGDPSLLEREWVRADEQAVASQFGAPFAGSVMALEPGPWSGPVASSFGFHLVRVSDRQSAESRPFADVREQVLEEWYRLRQVKADEAFTAALFEKYDVRIDESVRPLIDSPGGSGVGDERR